MGSSGRRGNIIIALALVVVFAIIGYGAFFLSHQEGQKTEYELNIQKVRFLAESALEMAELKIRREMNDIPAGQIQMITGLLKAITNPKESWFLKFRAPGFLVKGGISGQTGFTDVKAEANLSFDKLLGGVNWANQTLDAGDLKIGPMQDELYGDSEVKVTVRLKHMRPITSQDDSASMVFFEGAETDDKPIQDWIKKFGTKITDFFVGLLPGGGKLDFSKFIKDIKFEFSIYGIKIPIPIGDILQPLLGKILTIDLGALLEKAFENFANSLHIGNLDQITGEIVIEKMATLEFIVESTYKARGKKPYSTRLVATKDIKVVDLMPIQPLYTFFWTGDDNNRDKDWWSRGGGHFTLNSFPEGNIFKSIAALPDVFKNARIPGQVFIGGSGKNVIPVGFFDFLLYLPKYSTYTPVFVNPPGTDNWHHPWLTKLPAGFTFWPPFVPLLPIDPFSLVGIIGMFKKPKVHLFGKFCLSPPLDLKIHGNVYKMFQRTFVVGIPQIFLVFVYIPPMGIYAYREVEKPYSYSFFESDLKSEKQVQMENLYRLGQYKSKATSVYSSNEDFHKDPSVFTPDGVVVDGVYYIEGDAAISGNVRGAGIIVTSGNLTAKDITHDWQEADGPSGKKVKKPFSLIAFKKLNVSGKVEATCYAEEGIQTSGKAKIYGNLAVKKFDKGEIGSDLEVNFDARRTTPSLLALLPYVGRYIPHRYRVILSRQYSTWKYEAPEDTPK